MEREDEGLIARMAGKYSLLSLGRVRGVMKLEASAKAATVHAGVVPKKIPLLNAYGAMEWPTEGQCEIVCHRRTRKNSLRRKFGSVYPARSAVPELITFKISRGGLRSNSNGNGLKRET